MKALLIPVFIMAMLAMLGIAGAQITYTSNAITTPIDYPQNAVYTISNIAGGILPYTFNVYVTNSNSLFSHTLIGSNTFSPGTTNAIIITINSVSTASVNVIAYNGVQSSTNVLFSNTIPTGSNTIYGAWTFNAFFADSTGASANTIASSNTLTINPALAVSVSPASNTLDANQALSLATTVSGGTPSFSIGYTPSNSLCGSLSSTSNTLSADGSNTIIFTANSLLTSSCTTTFTASVTDHASTQVTQTATSSLTVNPTPTANSLTPSNTVLDSGQSVTYNVILNGGTLPITANLVLVSNSIPLTINGANAVPGSTYNTIVLGSGSAEPNTITFNSLILGTSNAIGGSAVFTVNAVDSANTPVTFNSLSSTITVDPAPSITLTATPSNSIPYGKSFTVNAVISGGTGHFAVYWFLNSNSITPTVISANTETSNTMQLPAAGNYAYTVEANDIGTSSVYTLTPATNTVVVSSNSTLTASETGNPGTSYFEQPVSITFTGTPTINNQSAWSLYVNGVLFGKTASTITWSESMKNPGTYSFTFNNPGNSNYASNTLTTTLNIVYPPSGVTGPATTVTTTIPTTTVTTTIPPTPIVGSSGTVNKTISSSAPVTLNFSNELAIFSISTTSSAPAPISTFVANATKIAPPAPSNFTLINALNISIKTSVNVTANVTIAYPCSDSASSIAPFIYKNGTWSAITPFFVNPATCTVSFAVPSDPLVGIFAKTVPVTTTVPTTTVAPTTTIPTTVPVTPVTPHYNGLEIAIVVIVIIVIILVTAYYYATKGKRSHR